MSENLKMFLRTAAMLSVSNLFMNYAWYGPMKKLENKIHLFFIILISWGIAFFEYCLAVPANQKASQTFSLFQLKILQEAITLVAFCVVVGVVFGQTLKWNHAISFGLLLLAVFFAFRF